MQLPLLPAPAGVHTQLGILDPVPRVLNAPSLPNQAQQGFWCGPPAGDGDAVDWRSYRCRVSPRCPFRVVVVVLFPGSTSPGVEHPARCTHQLEWRGLSATSALDFWAVGAAEAVVPATELQHLPQAVRSRRDNEGIHLTRVAWVMRLATVLPLP